MFSAVLGTIARALRSILHAGIGDNAEAIRMRAILFQEKPGLWCAQCLEHDIAVQASSESELIDELVDTLSMYVEIAVEKGKKPFVDIPPAPAHFFKMIESAREVKDPIQIADKSEPLSASIIRMFQPVYS